MQKLNRNQKKQTT